MKILHTEASTGWGGQEIRILREAEGMRNRGLDVIIASCQESTLLSKAKKEDFKTVAVDFRRRKLLYIVPFFKRLIEKENIDVVNTHSSKDSWLVLPAARLARNSPLVIRTRHLSTKVHKGLLNRFLYNYLPHFVMTTGKAIKEQLVTVNGYDADKIVSIPTGVDTGFYYPQTCHNDVREELSIPGDCPLVGMVSALRSWKGHLFFIRAVPHVLRKSPSVRFIITGEGPYRATIEQAINEANVRSVVHMLGHREDVLSILSSLDIFVHPSYANEGVPQALLQAMAMKKPVIASDLEPLREVVKDGATGTLTPVRNPEAMASSILLLLNNREKSSIMCENARRLMEEKYSYAKMLDSIESLYGKRKKQW